MIRERFANLSIRQKLTVTYAAMFLAAGAILLGLNYTLMAQVVLAVPSQGALTIHPGIGQALHGPAASIALSNDIRSQLLNQLLLMSSVALTVMAIISGLLGWFVAGRVVTPLKQMTATAKRLSERTLHERINLQGPDDELKDLANTFDALLARLDSAFDSQRRFVANASHELRTPLAISRAAVEVTLDKPRLSTDQWRDMAQRVLLSTERSERLIEGLLTLARGERGIDRFETVDLAHVTAQAIEAAAYVEHPVEIRMTKTLEPAIVHGDPELLERLAFNLIDNALIHNVDGGWVDVRTSAVNGTSTLHVGNGGPVITPEVVPMLFEPFRRHGVDRTGGRRGNGIGLSIVSAIAKSHGGTVKAEPGVAGGLEVIVTLPNKT